MVVSMDIREAGETIMRTNGVATGTDHKRQRSLRPQRAGEGLVKSKDRILEARTDHHWVKSGL